MTLTDHQIKAYGSNGQLITQNYREDQVNCISYDLTISSFIPAPKSGSYELAPGEFVMIRTAEEISIPDNLCGIIGEKNSRMRQGLVVSGPRYFPGHKTFLFLRVQNISSNVIRLDQGNRIAQIFFERLDGIPEKTYREQENASFQNERDYVGYGNYETDYKKHEKSFQSVKDSILDKEQQIYSNVLTFMGILVAIFSLISINYQAFTSIDVGTKYILVMNLTLALCICVLMGLILFTVNFSKHKHFILWYIGILTVLSLITIVVAFTVA